MRFSLISTCRNEISSFASWKSGILAQTRYPDEVIIVDAESTDGTTEALMEWAREDSRLKVVVEMCPPAQARNRAISVATCDNIVSADFGATYDRRWFEEISRPLEADPQIMVVAGAYAVDFQELRSVAARCNYFLEDGYRVELGPGFLPSNRSIAYRRQVWEQVGGYPEDLTFYADDTIFALLVQRHGFKTAYVPDAKCWWQRHARLTEYWRESFNYSRGNGEAGVFVPRLIQKFPGEMPAVVRLTLSIIKGLWHSMRPAFEALRHGEIVSCALLPILAIGKQYYAYCGFEVGMKHGSDKCRACRAKLISCSDLPYQP